MFPKASATFPSRLNRPPWLRNGFLVTQKLEKIFIPTVEQVPVNALKSDGQNPNRMTATQTQSLLVGIQRYGFLLPIVTNKDLLIADGEQRWDIAKRLGMTSVPVVRLPVEDVDRRLLRQILNKLKGEHVLNLDVQEYQKIMDAGHRDDLKLLLGIDERNLRALMQRDVLFNANNQNFVPPAPQTTLVQKGDLYACGDHRVLCGDAANPDDVHRLLADTKVDSLQTDPPYGVYGKDWRLSLRHRSMSEAGDEFNDSVPGDYKAFTLKWLKNVPFNDLNTFYIWINQKNLLNLMQGIQDAGLYAAKALVWVKNAGVLTNLDYLSRHELCLYGWKGKHKFYGKKSGDTFFVNRPVSSKAHPTMKPVELIQPLIEDGSDLGMAVYDPFGGSGTTLVACEKSKRRCFMMETEPRYVDVILRRYTYTTNQEPKKL